MHYLLAFIWWFSSFVICTGTFHAYDKGKWPTIYNHRIDLVVNIGLGILYGIIGPIGIVLNLLLTGFWKYGWSL